MDSVYRQRVFNEPLLRVTNYVRDWLLTSSVALPVFERRRWGQGVGGTMLALSCRQIPPVLPARF
jgi:hypothetical protein